MAKIKTKRVRWDSSTSPDVAGYKLYWAIGQGVNYDSDAAEVGNVSEVILPDEVPSFPRVAGDIEIGVTAVNYKGNESDMSVCSAPFDFTAPEAPLNLVVEDTQKNLRLKSEWDWSGDHCEINLGRPTCVSRASILFAAKR